MNTQSTKQQTDTIQGTYIETPVGTLEILNNLISILSGLPLDDRDKMQDYLKNLNSVEQLIENINVSFNEVVNFFGQNEEFKPTHTLMDHELRNMSFDVTRFLEFFMIISMDSLEAEKKDSYLIQIMSGLRAMKSFLDTLVKYINERTTFNDPLFPLQDVAESLNLESPRYNKGKVLFDTDSSTQITFREYIVIRTLIDNALKEYQIRGLAEGTVRVHYYNDDKQIIIRIMDKATEEWPDVVHKLVKEGMDLAKQEDPAIKSQNGTKLSAYLLKKETPDVAIELLDAEEETKGYKIFEIRKPMASQETI